LQKRGDDERSTESERKRTVDISHGIFRQMRRQPIFVQTYFVDIGSRSGKKSDRTAVEYKYESEYQNIRMHMHADIVTALSGTTRKS